MKTRYTSYLLNLLVLSFGLIIPLGYDTFAIEPLQGPMVGASLWQDGSHPKSEQSNIYREHFAYADIPIPVPLWIALPFATLRYTDQSNSQNSKYLTDQRIGVGFLHHPAEGDPSWRFDATRVGNASSSPTGWARLILNLAKPYPWLKPKPSDSVYSWIGLNAFKKSKTEIQLIPEFAWQRTGSDGLALDLVLPRQFYFGYRAQFLGLLLGAEQSLRNLKANIDSPQNGEWTLYRIARAKLIVVPTPAFEFTASVMQTISQVEKKAALGGELTMKWNPNP